MTGTSPVVALGVFVTIVFVAAVAFFGWRDHQAVQRCEALGGETWDSGEHCVLGNPEVVSTRGGVWGQ